jgi:hypothetical protein
LAYSWSAPADQGAAIFNYQAEIKRLDNGITATWNAGGTGANPLTPLSVSFTGLTAAAHGIVRQRQFKFKVAGENQMGLGIWSEWASLTTAPRGWTLNAPNTPANPGRHSDTPVPGKVKIQWDAIGDENAAGGDDVAGITYEIWAGPTDLAYRAETSNNYYEQVVPSGQTWKFKVRSKNTSGQTSVWTVIMNMVSAALPSAPTPLTVSSTTATQVVMSWTVPSDNGGTSITAYEVSRDNFVNVQTVANTDTTVTLFGQPSAALLTYKVRARNAVGVGAEESQTITVA